MQLGRASMGTKAGTEGAELEPAHEELWRVLGRGHKAAGIRAPEGDPRKPHTDTHHDLRGERVPGGERIAGPEPTEALEPRITVPVQRKRPLVGCEVARAFPVHLVAFEPRIDVQTIALVWPPAIHAIAQKTFMLCPVADGVACSLGCCSLVTEGAMEVSGRDHVKDNLQVLIMQLLQLQRRMREDLLIEGEASMAAVPAGRGESCAEKDEGVDRQLLRAERLCLLENLRRRHHCPVGLLIAKRPEGRHLGEAGQRCILPQHVSGCVAEQQIHVSG